MNIKDKLNFAVIKESNEGVYLGLNKKASKINFIDFSSKKCSNLNLTGTLGGGMSFTAKNDALKNFK